MKAEQKTDRLSQSASAETEPPHGEWLSDWLRRCGQPEEPVALRVGLDVTLAVMQLHCDGLIHGAISTDSVFFDQKNDAWSIETTQSLSIDLSVAGVWPPELSNSGEIIVAREIPDALEALKAVRATFEPVRIDLYQIGALLCELLTGVDVAKYQLSPRHTRHLDIEVRKTIDRLTSERGGGWFPTAESLKHQLSTLLDSSTGINDSDTLPFRHRSPEVPASLGRFDVIRLIGAGGMGEVYEAYDNALDRRVAIKVLSSIRSSDEEFVARFKAEATAGARLTHPCIVQVFDIGQEENLHYIVMELIEGESLSQLLKREKQLSTTASLKIITRLLAALVEAHQQGYVHRDIKPANILICGRTGRVVLTDFGLARAADGLPSMTGTGVILGTADYIAPEQANGHAVDQRADLYSTGIVLYRLLTGELPFVADSPHAVVYRHIHDPAPTLPASNDIPESLSNIVERLLAKSPDARFQSAAELLEELRTICPEAVEQVDLIRSSVPPNPGSISGHSSGNEQSRPDRWQPRSLVMSVILMVAIVTSAIVANGHFNKPANIVDVDGHKSPVVSLAWSPDGKQLVSGGGTAVLSDNSDTGIRLWADPWKAPIDVFTDNMARASVMAWSSDQRYVLSLSTIPSRGLICIRDMESSKTIHREFTGPYDFQYSAAALPGTSSFVVAGNSGVGILSVSDGDCHFESLDISYPVHALAAHPNESRLLFSDASQDERNAREIVVWDIESQREIRRLSGHAGEIVSIATDGSIAVSLALEPSAAPNETGRTATTGMIRVWNLAGDREAKQCVIPNVSIQSSGTGNALAIIAGEVVGVAGSIRPDSTTQDLVRWNADTGIETGRIRTQCRQIHCLAVSPDGTRIAIGDNEGRVLILNAASEHWR